MYSLIRDDNEVNKQASQYPVSIIPPGNALLVPTKFDGRDSWNLYIRPPSNSREMPSVAIVAKDVFNDRYTLLSGGQIEFDLDHFQILACKDKAAVVNASPNTSASGLVGKVGYNIFDAWEYIYSKGLSQLSCFSLDKLKQLNVPTVDTTSYEQKIQLLGFQCDKYRDAEDTQCLSKINGIPVAKRIFVSSSIYNVTSPEMSNSQKIAAIKYDLTKWGPVAAGLLVYENFAAWNGQSVYTETQGRILGGHYVAIIGWKEDYWICRNSWGSDWGLLGYCRIRMSIPGLTLEDNVSATLPQFYIGQPSLSNGKWKDRVLPIEEMQTYNPALFKQRQALQIDYSLNYRQATIEAIRQGRLYGKLTPLIAKPELLPKLNKFWVMDITNFKFENVGNIGNAPILSNFDTNVVNGILVWLFFMIGLTVFVLVYNNKGEQ